MSVIEGRLSALNESTYAQVLKRVGYENRVKEMMASAPLSVIDHARLLHRDDRGYRIEAQRHHREWARMFEDVEEYPYLCIVAPPGMAKTTWSSVIYPTWRIGTTGGQVRVGLISRTGQQASALSMSVQNVIETQRFQDTYPGVVPDIDRQWTKNSFYVKGAQQGPFPTMFAAGLGSPAVQGKRFDEIILDDPVNPEDARSEVTMESIRMWLRNVLLERFPVGWGPPDGQGRMICVMTRWSERDLVPTLEDLGFKIVTMPALGYWDRWTDDDGVVHWGDEPLWPEKESREALHQFREEREIDFELVMQGNPRVLSGDIFNPQYFQRGPAPPASDFDQIIQYADTASGKDRMKGDYFALATVGTRAEGREIWILDMVRGRWPTMDQERIIQREYARWDDYGRAPDLVVIEDANEGIALYQRLVVNTRLPLKKFSPTKDKETRAIPLANAYRARMVWHPDNERWVRPYESELASFPQGAHDDQVDAAGGAFAMGVRPGPRIRMLTS